MQGGESKFALRKHRAEGKSRAINSFLFNFSWHRKQVEFSRAGAAVARERSGKEIYIAKADSAGGNSAGKNAKLASLRRFASLRPTACFLNPVFDRSFLRCQP